MIEVIKNKEEWNKYLSLVKESDFYHTYDYHQLSKTSEETPILIKFKQGQTSLVLPLLLRTIENSDYKDATSVYGYAGALAINIADNFEQQIFKDELNAYFKENKIVSVFSRLHPFIECQDAIHSGIGTVVTMGKVVYIDLTETIEDQRAKFNRRLKTYLNKSRKLCTVIEGNIDDHLQIFIDIYHENMRRVDADDSYFFDDHYYRDILNSDNYESELLLCIHNETQTIIGCSMFMKKGDIVQYHLSGLNEDYSELNPIKLIIDEMRIKATNEGFKYFNLGGGLGSSEDSLFRFKSGFSKNFKEFKLWKHIVDEDAYKILIKQKLGEEYAENHDAINFFPAYRAESILVS